MLGISLQKTFNELSEAEVQENRTACGTGTGTNFGDFKLFERAKNLIDSEVLTSGVRYVHERNMNGHGTYNSTTTCVAYHESLANSQVS